MPAIRQVSFTTPYQADELEILRRQKLADMLQQQAATPIPADRMAGGWAVPISPWEGAAKIAQGAASSIQADRARSGAKELSERYQREGQEALVKGLRAWKGSPASTERIMDEQARGGEGEMADINAPAVAGDPMAAMGILGAHPATQGLSQALMAQMIKAQEPYTLAEGAQRFGAGGQPLATNPKKLSPDVVYREAGQDRRFGGISGNVAAQVASREALHRIPSGSALAQIQSAQSMHDRPSGSAILGSNTTMRGQDIGATTARRGQDMSAETTRRGQDIGVDPSLQGTAARAKAAGRVLGEATTQTQLDLPQAVATAEQSVKLIDQMIGDLQVDEKGRLKGGDRKPHPGFSVGVGASAQPGFQYVPGTDKASFYALKDQVLGGAFMEAYKTLKGGGQITEVEGQKATAAVTRMNTAQSEPEFVKAAREFQEVIAAGVQRAKQRGSMGGIPQRPSGGVIDFNSLPR